MKHPKLTKGANTRIEWSREVTTDKGESVDQEFLIDGFVSPAKAPRLIADADGYDDSCDEEQEILDVFHKTDAGWRAFDVNTLEEAEIEAIQYSLSEEYWAGREMEDEEVFYDDILDLEPLPEDFE